MNTLIHTHTWYWVGVVSGIVSLRGCQVYPCPHFSNSVLIRHQWSTGDRRCPLRLSRPRYRTRPIYVEESTWSTCVSWFWPRLFLTTHSFSWFNSRYRLRVNRFNFCLWVSLVLSLLGVRPGVRPGRRSCDLTDGYLLPSLTLIFKV